MDKCKWETTIFMSRSAPVNESTSLILREKRGVPLYTAMDSDGVRNLSDFKNRIAEKFDFTAPADLLKKTVFFIRERRRPRKE